MKGGYFAALILYVSIAIVTPFVQRKHNVECGPIDSACECDPNAAVCVFQLYVETVFTFTRYNLSRPYAQGQGELFFIDADGNTVSYHMLGGRFCEIQQWQ